MKTKSRWLTRMTAATAVMLVPATNLMAEEVLTWTDALGSGDNISAWVKTLITAIMAIFIMVAIILGSLAFKQLAADGNWKDFWSKIAGAVGMFVVPIAVKMLAT